MDCGWLESQHKKWFMSDNHKPHQNVFLRALVQAPERLDMMYKAISGVGWRVYDARDDFNESFNDLFRVCMDKNDSKENANIVRDIVMVVGNLYEIPEEPLLKLANLVVEYGWTSFIPEHEKLIKDAVAEIGCTKKMNHAQIRACKNVNYNVDKLIVKYLLRNFHEFPDPRMDDPWGFEMVIANICHNEIKSPMHSGISKMDLERVFKDKELIDRFIALGNGSRTLDIYSTCYYFNEHTKFMAPYLRFINMKYDRDNVFFTNGYRAMQNCIDNDDMETFKILVEMGIGVCNTDLDRNNIYGYAVSKNIRFLEVITSYINRPYHKYIAEVVKLIPDPNYQICVDMIAENIKPFEYIHALRNANLYYMYTYKYDVPMYLMIYGRFVDAQKLYDRLAKHFAEFKIILNIDRLTSSYKVFTENKTLENLRAFAGVCSAQLGSKAMYFERMLIDKFIIDTENGCAKVTELLKFLQDGKCGEFIKYYNQTVEIYKTRVQAIRDVYKAYPGVITDPNKISDRVEYFNLLHAWQADFVPGMGPVLIENYKRMMLFMTM